MTGSWSLSQALASAGLMNFGSSIGGMPSRGGPPDWISASGISALEKSVFQPRVEKASWVLGTEVAVGGAVAGAVAAGAVVGWSSAAGVRGGGGAGHAA